MARKGLFTKTLTLPNGKRKYVTAKTQEELDQKVFEIRLQLRMGVDVSDETTVGEMIQIWFRTEVEPNVKPDTAKKMKGIINKHVLPYISAAKLKDVKPIHIQQIISGVSHLNQQSTRTVLRALREPFAMAEENGLILRSPVLQRFKPGGFAPEEKKALTTQQEKELLRVLTALPETYLFVWVGLATGMRRGELCALMWDCVDLDNATIQVRRNLNYNNSIPVVNEYTKTKAGMRTVAIPYDLCEVLKERRRHTKSLFVLPNKDGTPYTANQFYTLWRQVTARFGPEASGWGRRDFVKTSVEITPHTLRHTFATRCFESGMDIKQVQHLLGHATPDVTLRIYTHFCAQERQEETLSKARAARSLTECTTFVPHSAVISG